MVSLGLGVLFGIERAFVYRMLKIARVRDEHNGNIDEVVGYGDEKGGRQLSVLELIE